jgi:hypothetical protein
LNKDNEWIKAFYRQSMEENNKTLSLIDEVLTWRNDFGVNSNKSSISSNLNDYSKFFVRSLNTWKACSY